MTDHETAKRDRTNLTPEEIKEACRVGRELAHSREYEIARAFAATMGRALPPWDEIPPERRDEIKKLNHEHWKEMDDFGKSLAHGK